MVRQQSAPIAAGKYEVPTAVGRPDAAFVYRLIGADDELLYVGLAFDVAARVGGHAAKQPWWPRVRRVEWEMHRNRQVAAMAEAQQIRTLHPLFNVVHRRREPAAAPPPVTEQELERQSRAAHAKISPFDQVASW